MGLTPIFSLLVLPAPTLAEPAGKEYFLLDYAALVDCYGCPAPYSSTKKQVPAPS